MKSYKSKKLPYIEAEKNIFIRESPKKILLNSEKIKDVTTTASRIPSCISTSQEYQIENSHFPKSKSSKKQNQPKNDFIIFKNYLNPDKNSVLPKSQKNSKNNVKKTLSVDKIGKNQINIVNNNKNNTKSFIENNLNKKENVKNEMNEIIQKFVDNNLQNNKNCNFFRLFKMKRKNQNNNNNNKEDIFPPLYVNYPPLETEQNIFEKKNGNKYLNLLTKQNEDKNAIHYRDTLINSVNKNKENKIFIKIDEHFNKLNNDKSPKIIKKNFQGVIKNIKSNNINNNNNNINNLINISSNGKNIKNISKDENYLNINFKSLTNEKNIEHKDNKIKDINLINNLKNNNNRTPSCEEKIKNLYHKKNKNRLKIKIVTPISKNIYANKDEFNFEKSKEKSNANRYRNNTPNVIINNNIANSCQIKNNSNRNKIHFELDINKIKNKKIETIDDNNLADSFREELNILISDVNNSEKDKNNNEIKNETEIDTQNKKNEYSLEDCVDEIKININDEFIEKKIPEEEKERINLIKKFNRPETPSKK